MAQKYVTHGKANNPNNIEQWVSRVINYSSQYDPESWPASCVIGQPKVYPKYGDIAGAWAQKHIDANQYLEVEFEEKIFIEKVDIYETYHAGSVKRIKAKRPNGGWFVVWETPKVCVIKSSRIFSPPFERLHFQCNLLRIDVDCTAANSWTEIDAIKIAGTKFNFDLPPAPEDITNDLAKLVNNEDYSDVRFDVNGTIFHGHKAILSVRSEYFKAMFSSDFPTQPMTSWDVSKENLARGMCMPSAPPPYDFVTRNETTPIKLQNVDEKAFAVIMHYIYTNKLPPLCQSTVLTKVWRTADRFSLNGLKSLAIFELSSGLTKDNVVDIYVDVISALPIIESIKTICESYMQENIAEIVRLPSFSSLPHDIMVELIQKMTEKMNIR